MYFPQLAYFQMLRDKLLAAGEGKFNPKAVLTDAERVAWYCYDYGWRRVALGDFSHTSSIDPNGKCFNEWMVDDAEREWRTSPDSVWRNRSQCRTDSTPPQIAHKYRIAAAYQLAHGEGQTLPAGLSEDDPQVLVWLARLDERESAFRAKIARRPEESDDEHVTRIAEIARANIGAFVKNTRVRRKGKGDPIARVHAELGTHAAPRAVEDPTIAAMVEGWREEMGK